jgi:hypothetical protein
MSADNIATCPRCGECALREWYEIGIEHDDPVGQLKCTYECKCYECEYIFTHTFDPVTLQLPRGSTTCKMCYDGGCGEDGCCDGDCGDICASAPAPSRPQPIEKGMK